MLPPPLPRPPGFPRRTLLTGAAGAAALALLAGCTSGGDGGDAGPGREEADRLAAQVPVQESVVAAYAAAATADPGLGERLAVQAGQAQEQLDRLRSAAPGGSPASSPAPADGGTPPAGGDPQAWLREQVGAAAGSHESACTELAGARAALLGSVAAGLRGQEAVLA
ncbi:hypothetical protein [Blastococcus sp. SYSU D00695]